VIWSDLNGDGHQDILVANYRLDPNLLWLNTGAGRFRDTAARYGIRGTNAGGYFGHTVGTVILDLDNDQDRDVFLSNLAHPRYRDVSDSSRPLLDEG
jgi:hypothetical protein